MNLNIIFKYLPIIRTSSSKQITSDFCYEELLLCQPTVIPGREPKHVLHHFCLFDHQLFSQA